jgi:hypothetical protein
VSWKRTLVCSIHATNPLGYAVWYEYYGVPAMGIEVLCTLCSVQTHIFGASSEKQCVLGPLSLWARMHTIRCQGPYRNTVSTYSVLRGHGFAGQQAGRMHRPRFSQHAPVFLYVRIAGVVSSISLPLHVRVAEYRWRTRALKVYLRSIQVPSIARGQ